MGLFDWFSGDAQKEAAQARIAGLQAGQREANASIDTGLGQLKDYYKQAGDYFAPLATAAGARTGAGTPEVRILLKNGTTPDITAVSDLFDRDALSEKVTKYFLCYPKEIIN